jgi:hypothetical protein
VSVESNDDAYLYIVNRGSSGTWNVLFPSPEIDNGNNRVPALQSHVVPARGQFTFSNPPGDEGLFIVLSREPEPDFDTLIYSLNKQSAPNRPEQRTLSAQNIPINDALVGKFRNTVLVGRDLVFEKVDEMSALPRVDDTIAKPKEKAAYVVNMSGGRVVADVTLKHR